MGVVPSRGLTPKTLIRPFAPEVAPAKVTLTSKCPKSGLTAEAVVVARPSSVPLASSTTATTVPLSTLAVPDTSSGELIAVLESGLSMMIFDPSGIGVAAVAGRLELAGVPLAVVEGEAPVLAEALGEPLSSTNVVVLSPPHPANTTANARKSPAPNPFMAPSSAPIICGARPESVCGDALFPSPARGGGQGGGLPAALQLASRR